MIEIYQLQGALPPVEVQTGGPSEATAAEQIFSALFAQSIAEEDTRPPLAGINANPIEETGYEAAWIPLFAPLPCSSLFAPAAATSRVCVPADTGSAGLAPALQEDAQEDSVHVDRALCPSAAYGVHLHSVVYASRGLPQLGVLSTGALLEVEQTVNSLRTVETAAPQSRGAIEAGRTIVTAAGEPIESGQAAEKSRSMTDVFHEASSFRKPDVLHEQTQSAKTSFNGHVEKAEELHRSADVRAELKRRPVPETIDGAETQSEIKPAFTKAVASASPQAGPKPAAPVASQIIERLESATARSGVKELSMELNPKELGRIHVKLELDEGRLVIRIEPKRADTHRLLGGNIDKLIAGLGLKDVRIEHITQTEAKTTLPPYSGDTGSQHSLDAHTGSQHSDRNSRYEAAATYSAYRQNDRAAGTEGIEQASISTAHKSSGIHRLDYIV